MKTSFLEAALEYAARGWAVFPLQPRGKRPIPGTSGHNDASTDPAKIRSWWKEIPNANIGIRCDSESGPIVIDVDGPEGRQQVKKLKISRTLQATSGRPNRRHFYFSGSRVPLRRMIKILPGIDMLADGGYVVAPPSIHPDTNKPYRWTNDRKALPFPKRIYELIRSEEVNRSAPPLPETIGEGQRDDLLTSLAGTMRRRGASEEGILAALLEENEHRCVPPLPEKQVRKIAKSIARKQPSIEYTQEDLSDMGNARRFIRQHIRDVRHVMKWADPWLVWDGIRWTSDDTGEVDRLVKKTIRSIQKEAVSVTDDKERKSLLLHAQKSQASSRQAGLKKTASTEPEISMVSEAFDNKPWLINVENGTIDLATGELRPPRRDDLMTKMTPVIYDPKAKAPLWLEFLDEITEGNGKLQDYLQAAVGYSLTGVTSEQCLFFCYGTGSNGKSTFLEVIRSVIGPEYVQQAEFSTFLQSRNTGPRTDLARMRGVRMVTAVEASSHQAFDEAIVKQVTGGDTITARHLYGSLFEFKPTHKVWMAANHKPKVQDQTEAFWRRIRLIPFTAFIPPGHRDRRLKEKLELESSGIFNWALQGCLRWANEGLGAPIEVLKATESYREEEDVIGEFIEARCEEHPKAWTSTSEIYSAFSGWWKDTRGAHSRIPNRRWFGRSLGERHSLTPHKRANTRGWKGVALKIQL